MSAPTPSPTPPVGDERRFRALVDLSPDILSIFDAEGRLTFNSAAAWRTHGYTAEDLQGRSTFDFVHPEDRAAVEAEFRRVLEKPVHPGHVRYRYRNADGTYTWMEAAGRNELGTPGLDGVISISRDISDRGASEEALRAAEHRFRMLFAANPQPMTIFDLETLQFREANDTALELYGYTREELLGIRSRDIRPPDDLPRYDRVIEQLRDARCTGKVEHRGRHLAKDGRIIDVVVLAQRIEWLGRAACLTLIQDVTEQLQLQTKLQQTQKLESLGLLAGGIAHDFNNLLTSILGHAALAEEDMPAGSAAQESLRIIQESALRAADLCRQMLAYSGRGRFTIDALDLGGLVRSTIDLLRITIPPNVTLHLDLAANLPPIEGEATQLQQVAMNLALNAADAIGESGGVVRLATRLVRADRALLDSMYLSPQLPEGDYVRVQVTDTGCGMTPETLARVFDPFFTTKFTGRGLGLAAVLGIVRGHRGAIRVESAPGLGTTFTLLFPAIKEAPPAPAPQAPSTADLAPLARTVLVVEDEASVRRTVEAVLKRQGITLLFAVDGLSGVELFRQHHRKIDAVLLDLTMPKMSGAEALRHMRAIDPAARILLMSGFDETVESERHENLGQVGFVQKPFTPQLLVEKIRTALARSSEP